MRPIPNPQLAAMSLIIKKYGERIPGGYEVRFSALEITEMSPHGIFQEVPDIDGKGIRWQYFPNDDIIDLKPGDWKEEAPVTAIVKVEKKDG